MNSNDFHKLVHMILESPAHPPESLFAQGFDDWHARARMAHFLAMPEYEKKDLAIELFRSIVDIDIDEENSEDVEEKVFALQKLSACLRENETTLEDALDYINIAIELAESTDYLYKYILRGELWADRWLTLHLQKKTEIAEAEIAEKIEIFEPLPIPHNSYLYYGYRFKAQIAAERGTTLIAKDFMHMALSFMDVPKSRQEKLQEAFQATHDNAAWILNDIDHATPATDKLHWDI